MAVEDKKVTEFVPTSFFLSTDIFGFVRPTEVDEDLQNVYITGADLKNELMYPTVANFSALPPAGDHPMEIYICLAGEGIYLINRKNPGMYYSDGVNWNYLGDVVSYFSDVNFRIYDATDNTKEVRWELDPITTGNLRTITMADTDIDLADIGLNNTHRTSDGTDHSFINQDVTTLGTPSFVSGSITGGNFSVTNPSATAEITVNASAVSQSSDVLLTNATGTWRIRNNSGNNDFLLNRNGINVINIAGNITNDEALNIQEGTVSWNRNGIDRNFKVFGFNSGSGVPELLEVDAGLGRVMIGGGVTPPSPSEVLDVQGNIAVTGTVDGIDIATDVAANTAKVSADGSVTTHNDVTSAGSGAIITDAERTKLSGIEAGADVTDSTNVLSALVAQNLVVADINTGQGVTEVYPMNQAVRTTDAPTFNGGTFNDRVTLSKAGTTGFTITDTTRGTASLDAGAECDYKWNKTTGAAIMDYEAKALDGVSECQYRFGLSSGSTGSNKIIMFDRNSANLQAQIASSDTTSYICRQGGQFVVGSNVVLSGAELSVHGEIVNKTATSASLSANGDFEITTPSNTQVTFNYRGTDGVTRSATLTLS